MIEFNLALLFNLALVFCTASTVAAQGLLFPGATTPSNGRCQMHNGRQGWCRPIASCPPMLALAKNGGFPKICGFHGQNPIVCCPTTVDLLKSNSSDAVSLRNVPAPANVPKCGERSPIFESPSTASRSRRERNSFNPPVDFSIDQNFPGLENPHSVEVAAGVGFKLALRDSWPWLALMGKRLSGTGEMNWYCDGALINERWVLTAAHCFREGRPDVVRLGEHDHSTLEDGALHKDYTVARMERYPDYQKDGSAAKYHDLALMQLSQPVAFTPGIAPVCLPWGEEGDYSLTNKVVMVAGWGDTSFGGEKSTILQEAEVTVFPSERCQTSYGSLPGADITYPDGITADTFLCAGNATGGVDTCQSDSGGPMVYRRPGNFRFIVGAVVSHGYGCGLQEFPGLYVPVAQSRYLSWIKDVAFS